MSKILDITIDFEPTRESETRFDLNTGDFRCFPIDGYRGRIMIGSRSCETFGGNMIFNIRKKLEPKEVLEAEIKLLEDMRSDIDEAINELSKK